MDSVLRLVCGSLLFLGCYTLLQGSRRTYVSITRKPGSQKKRSKYTLTRLDKILLRIDNLLLMVKKDRGYLCRLMSLAFFGGSMVGYFCFQGWLLALITGLICSPLAILYLIFRTQDLVRGELVQLENAMSIITNAYLACGDITVAFQKYIDEENRFRDMRFQKTTPFHEFLTDALMINPDVDLALQTLQAKYNNPHFTQWIRYLQLCVKDRNVKYSLPGVIAAMRNEKILQTQNKTLMSQTWTAYLSVVGAMYLVIPTLRYAEYEWYLILVKTPGGQLMIALMLLATLLTGLYVVRLNKPISTI